MSPCSSCCCIRGCGRMGCTHVTRASDEGCCRHRSASKLWSSNSGKTQERGNSRVGQKGRSQASPLPQRGASEAVWRENPYLYQRNKRRNWQQLSGPRNGRTTRARQHKRDAGLLLLLLQLSHRRLAFIPARMMHSHILRGTYFIFRCTSSTYSSKA